MPHVIDSGIELGDFVFQSPTGQFHFFLRRIKGPFVTCVRITEPKRFFLGNFPLHPRGDDGAYNAAHHAAKERTEQKSAAKVVLLTHGKLQNSSELAGVKVIPVLVLLPISGRLRSVDRLSAKGAIARISQTRDDVAVFVEPFINHGGVDCEFWIGFGELFQRDRGGHDRHNSDIAGLNAPFD